MNTQSKKYQFKLAKFIDILRVYSNEKIIVKMCATICFFQYITYLLYSEVLSNKIPWIPQEGKVGAKLYEQVKKYKAHRTISKKACGVSWTNLRHNTMQGYALDLHDTCSCIPKLDLYCCQQVNEPLETMLKYAWRNLHSLASHSVSWDLNYIYIHFVCPPNRERVIAAAKFTKIYCTSLFCWPSPVMFLVPLI